MEPAPTPENAHPCLIVLAGLPGVGKSTLARELSRTIRAYHLRVDAIEDGMKAFGISGDQIAGSGYVAIANLAAENLALGFSSVVDCVNPLPLTRQMFLEVATAAECDLITVEVMCSDAALHRMRLESRGPEPTWQDVVDRDYQPWPEAQFRIDTAKGNPADWIAPINRFH